MPPLRAFDFQAAGHGRPAKVEVEMAGWRAQGKTRVYPTHTPTLQEIAIFAASLLAAMMVGIAASGVLPLV